MSTDSRLKRIRTGVWNRGAALGKLAIKAGAGMAQYQLKKMVQSNDASAKLAEVLLNQAQDLALTLGQLKGSVMKVGQMLSMYGEHFLPEEVNRHLKTLQFESPPLEWQAVRAQLIKEMGSQFLADLEIDEVALASASVGQVHRARIRQTGEEVVLKIQYPDVDKAIQSDLKVLRSTFRIAEWTTHLDHLDMIFDEVAEMLFQEIDYKKEAENLTQFASWLADDPRYILPKVYPAFSGQRVLCLSYEPGFTLDSAEVQSLSLAHRNHVARAMVDLYYRELFEFRAVQTDPHAGNYRVRLNVDGSPPQLILFDYGAVRRFDSDFVENYARLADAALRGDVPQIRTYCRRLGFIKPNDPHELEDEFIQFCFDMVEPFSPVRPQSQAFFNEHHQYDWHQSDLPRRITMRVSELIRRFPLRTPPREVIFLDRKTGGAYIFCSILKAQFQGRDLLENRIAPHLLRPA